MQNNLLCFQASSNHTPGRLSRPGFSFCLPRDDSILPVAAPHGTEITIDPNDQENAPCPIKLTLGTHSLKLRKSGFQLWVRSIEFAAGELRTVAADLNPLKP
jgi:hypothetical protein